jgi:hypothetical protein
MAKVRSVGVESLLTLPCLKRNMDVKKQKVNLELVKQSDIEIDYLSRQCVFWGFWMLENFTDLCLCIYIV